MNDRHLIRGLVRSPIAMAFGLGALRSPRGDLAHARPGLLPPMIGVTAHRSGSASDELPGGAPADGEAA